MTDKPSSGEGNGNPLQCSCPENPRDRGAWWAAVYGVAQSRTWLKRFSSSSGIAMRMHTMMYSLGHRPPFFNIQSRCVLAFVPVRKCLNFVAAVTIGSDFRTQENKICHCFYFSPSICYEVMGLDTNVLVFECWVLNQIFHSSLSPSSRGSLVPLHFLPLEL